MRSVSWLSLVVGLLLIPAAAAIALREHDGAREQQQERLDSAATTQAAAVAAYFTRARSIILLTANAAPFREAATEAGGRRAIVARHSAALREATEHLTYLEHLYPSSIGEACFIVSGGGELARVTHGRIARAADLSPDERQTVFFRPTLDQPADGAYQAVPYRSPDVNDWVISNSAPVFARGVVRPVAIVHFEVTVESFRRALATAAVDQEELRIVDQRTGAVIAEADQPQRAGAPLGNPGDRRFVSLPGSGQARVDGRLASVRPLDRQPGNANHWVVVASSASPFPSLLGDLGPA
ncbi:MAG: signal peptide protein, partial [Solirubrobacterales bacterium]|nr:signal peptide protein [Solirubrobacterales bacterium]